MRRFVGVGAALGTSFIGFGAKQSFTSSTLNDFPTPESCRASLEKELVLIRKKDRIVEGDTQISTADKKGMLEKARDRKAAIKEMLASNVYIIEIEKAQCVNQAPAPKPAVQTVEQDPEQDPGNAPITRDMVSGCSKTPPTVRNPTSNVWATWDLANATSDDIPELIGTVSFGSLTGFITGFAAKKLGKGAAFTAGTLVLLFSAADAAGFVEVRWEKVEDFVMDVLDVNNDGVVDGRDAAYAMDKFFGFFKKNTAFAGGSFSGGLVLGLRMG